MAENAICQPGHMLQTVKIRFLVELIGSWSMHIRLTEVWSPQGSARFFQKNGGLHVETAAW